MNGFEAILILAAAMILSFYAGVRISDWRLRKSLERMNAKIERIGTLVGRLYPDD